MAFPFLKAALRQPPAAPVACETTPKAEGRLVFEALEPRVLLSADALSVAVRQRGPPIAHE